MKTTTKYKLGDICNIVSGGTPKRSERAYWDNGSIPWVKISDIKSKFITSTEERITEQGLNSSSAKLLQPGTILFSIFATLGAVGILKIPACTNQAIAGITPKDDELIDLDFLYCWLLAQGSSTQDAGRGVAQNNINLSILRKTEVVLPDKTLQRLIAKRLCEIEQLKDNNYKQLVLLDELVKSRFIEMFGDEKIPRTTVESVCSIVTDGTHQPPRFVDRGIPFLFVSNIVNYSITYDTKKFISQDTYHRLIKRTPLEKGDVLLTTVGSYGNPAVVENDMPFCFQRHIAYMKPVRERINSQYLKWALLSPLAQNQIEQGVKGIAQKTLNLSVLKAIEIPLSPINLQQEFAAFVAQVDKLKFETQQAIDRLQMLYDSLAQEYFGSKEGS